MFFWFVITGTVLVWLYVLFIREWMVERWPEKFTRWHAMEDMLWAKSRTILGARLYWVGGIVVAIHDMAASLGMDWTPIMTQITAMIPERYRELAAMTAVIATGLLFEYLRRITTTALREKD